MRLLYFMEREKDVIKCGGCSIFPSEVERHLIKHPDVEQAVVIGVPDEIKGQLPAAVIVLRPARVHGAAGAHSAHRPAAGPGDEGRTQDAARSRGRRGRRRGRGAHGPGGNPLKHPDARAGLSAAVLWYQDNKWLPKFS